MTIAERNNKLKHFITCLKCKIKGHVCDDNCSTQYDAGNMGEIIENLEAISKALEQEPCEDCVSRKALIERINHAEENFKADNMESIGSDDGDPFVDGVLSGVFNIREMVIQAPSVTPQEPFKPMVEIDLYSVIKQKYIERDVLDKIRAEVEKLQKMCDKNDLNLMAQYSAFGMVLEVIDKYKAESEGV